MPRFFRRAEVCGLGDVVVSSVGVGDHWLEELITEVTALNESLAAFEALSTPTPTDETTTSPSPQTSARRKKRGTVGWLRPGVETLIALEDDKITLPSVVFFNIEERRPVYGRLFPALADSQPTALAGVRRAGRGIPR